jgi:phage tail sheath protein FI
MTDYLTPGVYIEEVTGPGVIAGVSTSNVAFIGPAARGPLDEPRLLTSLDEYIDIYGGRRDNRPTPYLFAGSTPFYMGFGVEGFFANGGQYAYVVRVGTAAQAELPIDNRDAPAEQVAIVRAIADGDEGNAIQVAVEDGAPLPLATGSATVTSVGGPTPGEEVTVDRPGLFAVGDAVVDDTSAAGTITQIVGSTLVLDAPLDPAAATVRLADLDTSTTAFRVVSTFGLRAGQDAIIDDGTNDERVTIQGVDVPHRRVTLNAALTNTYDLTATPPPTLEPVNVLALADATAQTVAGDTISLTTPATDFRVGDLVSDGTSTAHVTAIDGSDLTVDADVSGWGTTITLAAIDPAVTTLRVADTSNLYPGTVARLESSAGTDYVVVLAVDSAGFVQLDPAVTRAATHPLDGGAGTEPVLHREDFALVVTPPAAAPPGSPPPERHDGLALNPFHPRYLFNLGVVDSEWVTVEPPARPPTAEDYPDPLAQAFAATPLAGGQDDQPTGLTAAHYTDGLDALADVDDVNVICIPDAASHPDRESIQTAMIGHCLGLGDRFAVLDSGLGMPPSGPGSVDDQRDALTSERGFAALYYPWLLIRDPRSTGPTPRRMFVPPSGHVAGVYARVDTFPGVHKAPGNVDVRGALGLERALSDRQQGPLNRQGVNVLRVFPGDGRVIVWGARTTVDPIVTDWLYINVRRLLLYLEESIQEGIRWAVFQPNDLTLWQQLKRTIGDFLTRVWRDGALFGATAEEAFQVRIDAALNPPSVRALGRLNIEIKVAPVRPAEFIVVRIGLWDGGGDVDEG